MYLEELLNSTINNVEINSSNDVIKFVTDTGTYYASFEGDCCANCYAAHVNGSQFLKGAKVLSIQDTEWKNINSDDDDAYGDVVESMGVTINTDKGTCTIETRVEHNGYYGGYITVTKSEYDTDYKPLEDF